MSEKKVRKKKEGYNHFFAISHAKNLQCLARELEKTTVLNRGRSNVDLFRGKVVGTPILFGLATEVALKALLYQETNEVPPYIHDLLELFDGLKEDTQAELEVTFKELGKSTQGRLMAEFPRPSSTIRHVLYEHREVFVLWRYPFKSVPPCYSKALDEVISTIIKVYDKRILASYRVIA